MGNRSFKDDLKQYYNQEADLRDSKSQRADWKVRVRSNFFRLAMAEGKRTLLELGAGAGYDSRFFMDNGFCVTAVDISGEMVEKCRAKGIDARELDFYSLAALGEKYDCVYAINTLLHVPQGDLLSVLRQIDSVLSPGGLFYMGLYGGADTEHQYVKSEVSESPRLFAFYSAGSLKGMLEKVFDIQQFESFDIGTGTDIFHSIVLRKK